jgi:hypothetical protein
MAIHNSDARVALAKAINQSVNMFSEKLENRLEPVDNLLNLEANKKQELKNAKAAADKKYDIKEAETFLGKNQGWKPGALKAIKIIEAGGTLEAAAIFRQLFERAKDKEYYVPDLLDPGVFGTGTVDADQPAFDSTTTGKRQGGTKAEPKPVAAKDAEPPAREIPSISLEEAERRFKEAEAKHAGKRGPRPKDLKEAEATLNALKAAAANPEPAPDAAPEDETEATNVVSFAEQQRRANAAGDAMTRMSPAVPPAETAPAEEAEASKSKPGRKRTAKTAEEKAAIKSGAGTKPAEETAQAASSGPKAPPPMVDDDAEDEGDPDFPAVVPGQIGTAPSSYTQR